MVHISSVLHSAALSLFSNRSFCPLLTQLHTWLLQPIRTFDWALVFSKCLAYNTYWGQAYHRNHYHTNVNSTSQRPSLDLRIIRSTRHITMNTRSRTYYNLPRKSPPHCPGSATYSRIYTYVYPLANLSFEWCNRAHKAYIKHVPYLPSYGIQLLSRGSLLHKCIWNGFASFWCFVWWKLIPSPGAFVGS